MDKNILAEYQKRVEEILNTLDENKVVLDIYGFSPLTEEYLKESKHLEDNIERITRELELLQQPIDMSDVGISSLGTYVRDSRASTVRESYSDDREGYLLSEYDKRRIDPDEPNANIEKVIEEIRKEREAKRENSKKELIEELQEIEELKQQVEKVEEAQMARQQIVTEIQDRQQQVQSEITEIERERRKIIRKREAVLEAIRATEETENIKRLPEAVLKANKKAKENCMVKKARQEKKIAALEKKQNSLQQDYSDLDAILYKIYGEKTEVNKNFLMRSYFTKNNFEMALYTKYYEEDKLEELKSTQENQMWEEYREEQGRQEADKESQIDEAIRHKQEIEKGQEAREDRDAEDAVIAGYADGLNVEEPIEPGTYKIPVKEEGTAEPVKPTPQRTPETIKPQPATKKAEKVAFLIKEVGLKIEDEMPRYYAEVLLPNGEQVIMKSAVKGFEAIEPMNPDLREELLRRDIKDVDRFYDIGLVNFLEELDIKLGKMQDDTSMNKYPDKEAYIKMLAQKNWKSGKDELPFAITYDLSSLTKMPEDKENKAKIKLIQKIAKANKNKGLATYQKAPSFWKRLWSALTTKALPKPSEEMREVSEEQEEIMILTTVDSKTMEQAYKDLYSYPDFDIETFIDNYNMSEEEAEKYRTRYEEDKKQLETVENKTNKFKQRLAVQQENTVSEKVLAAYMSQYKTNEFDIEKFIAEHQLEGTAAEEIRAKYTHYEKGKALQEFNKKQGQEMREKRKSKGEGTPIVVASEDITILDKDGKEIGG